MQINSVNGFLFKARVNFLQRGMARACSGYIKIGYAFPFGFPCGNCVLS